MNRVLFKAAAIVNIAAAALIYVACSGDDGKDGPPGPAGSSCVGTPSATPGAIDITCGGVPAGTLQPGAQGAPGQNGQGVPESGCYLQATATGYNAICGGVDQGPLLTGGAGGGCSVNPGTLGDPYYIFTCPGGTIYQVAKAICGTEPYDPQMYACELSVNGSVIVQTLSKEKCGSTAIDTTIQFCQNAATSTVKYLCGPTTEEVRTYSATQFCQPEVASGGSIISNPELIDADSTLEAKLSGSSSTPAQVAAAAALSKIVNRCGGSAYSDAQFCYNNANVYQKCVDARSGTAVVAPSLIAAGGKTYEVGQLCQVDGKVQANCSGQPYSPDIEFCQGGTKRQLLCGRQAVVDSITDINSNANTTNVKGKEYSATQFCQVSESIQSDGSAKTDGEAEGGQIKTLCTTNTAQNTRVSFAEEYFCQANATTTGSAIALLCGYDADPGASPTQVTADKAKEYPATKFCQYGTGNSPGGVATTWSAARVGLIKDKCGTGAVANLKTYGTDYYCSLANIPATKVLCNATNKYDPETEFCITTGDLVQSTCKPRATPTTPNPGAKDNKFTTAAAAVTGGFYDPDTKVCEPRGNILYSYTGIGTKYWTTENVRPNGVSTFTWIDAKETACPADWELPMDADWDALVSSADEGSAGIYLRATSGWATNSTRPEYSIFLAVPAPVTGITPAPTGSYAYWWTGDEKGWVVNTSGQTVAGSDFNMGNYKSILELSTALGKGGSPKMTTSLSVRCVKKNSPYVPPTTYTEQQQCTATANCTWNNGAATCSLPTGTTAGTPQWIAGANTSSTGTCSYTYSEQDKCTNTTACTWNNGVAECSDSDSDGNADDWALGASNVATGTCTP